MLSNARFRCLCTVASAALGCDLPDDPTLTESEANLGSQLTRLRAYNNATNNYYAMSFSGPFAYHRIYIDTDESAATGFSYCGVGANYLIENTHAYQYAGTGTNWSWTDLGSITNTIDAAGAAWTVPRSTFAETAFPNRAQMCFETKTSTDVKDTSAIYTHVYSNETIAIHTQAAYNDGSSVFYQASFDVPVDHKHVFIDIDENPATGYSTGGVGADYMVENSSVYDYTGDGSSWSWTNVGASNMSPSTAGATGMTTWTFARSLITETGASERADLVWHGTPSAGGSSTYTAIYDHVYSGGTTGGGGGGTVEYAGYTPDTSATLKNPERGMYFGSPPTPSEFHTLNSAWLWLHDVCDATLTWNGYLAPGTSDILNDYVRDELLPARAAGGKVVFRPRYDEPDEISNNGPSRCTINGSRVFHADRPSGSTGLAQLDIQKNHVDAIAAMLSDYKDVIGFIQAGYLGRWGEWNTSSYGPANAPFLNSRTLRRALINYILDKYEQEGILQYVELRRSHFANEVLTLRPSARIGFHNDCFMTNSSDSGTFSNYDDLDDTAAPNDDYDFASSAEAKTWALANLTSRSFGGETCPLTGETAADQLKPEYHTERWRDCDKMIGTGGETSEPGSFHMDYLNATWASAAVGVWTSGQCYDEIRRKLGYRFEVLRVRYTPTVTAGQSFTVEVDIKNTGWSRLHKPRTAKIALRGPTTLEYTPANAAVQDWQPGATTTLSFTGTAPAAGNYSVRLMILDPDVQPPTAPHRIPYAIKLASLRNGVNVFDPGTGDNNLGVSINVQ